MSSSRVSQLMTEVLNKYESDACTYDNIKMTELLDEKLYVFCFPWRSKCPLEELSATGTLQAV